MTMNNSRLISNRIPLILQNHDHVSLKINADASGWFARNDGAGDPQVSHNQANSDDARLKSKKGSKEA